MNYYTEEQEDCILVLYELAGKSPKKAVKMFNAFYGEKSITPQTISKRWKYEGLNIPHGGHRHGLKDEEIKKIHEEHDGDIGSMIEKGHNKWKMAKRCSKLRLSIKNFPSQKKKLEEELEFHEIPRFISIRYV